MECPAETGGGAATCYAGEDLVPRSAARYRYSPVRDPGGMAAGVLETGQQGLRRRGRDPGERELTRTRAKLGELTMRLELARALPGKKGVRGRVLEKLLKRGRG